MDSRNCNGHYVFFPKCKFFRFLLRIQRQEGRLTGLLLKIYIIQVSCLHFEIFNLALLQHDMLKQFCVFVTSKFKTTIVHSMSALKL